MIKADHNRAARFVFDIYLNRLLRKNFSRFYLVNSFPEIPAGAGLAITPNHISWWDGFFIGYVTGTFLKRKFYVMMLEEQLRKYGFFRKLGAYSIEQGNPGQLLQSAAYTKSILGDESSFTVIFPQGKIEPFEKRPIELKNGLKFFINGLNLESYVLPVAFKIHYYNDKLPAVVCRFGGLIQSKAVIENFDEYRNQFIANIDALTDAAYREVFVADLFGRRK